jgi:uncharacterized membrane protein
VSFLLALVALVLAVVALTRTNALATLQRRVSALELDLTDLRRRFNALRREGAPAELAPAPVPVAVERPAAPPRPTSTPPPPPPPPSVAPVAPARPIDWERWIGIRGAAVLGGIALALAGLLFFQYSIQHGLISKGMRVTLGFVVGIACIAGSEWVRRRGYRPAAEGLAGAGVVVLYAAIWAGCARYQLLPVPLAFLLMGVVTVTCGFIAVARAAPYVAVLGLLGGFATPLLLSVRHDRPIGLFGYVLLLDLGLVAVGRMRSWPWVGLIGLAGTLVLEIVWLGAHTGPEGLVAALGILTVFAVLFSLSGFSRRDADESGWRAVQAGGLLLPFLFAVYFASRIDLGPHLWGAAVFAVILSAGASWVGKRAHLPFLAIAAALGSTATLAAWLLRTRGGAPWEAAIIACAFALTHHLFLERSGRARGLEGAAPAAVFSAVIPFLVLLLGSVMAQGAPPWPWIAAWLVSGALLTRQAGLTGLPLLQIVAAGAVAGDVGLQHVVHFGNAGFPRTAVYVVAMLGIGLLAQLVPFLRRDETLRRSADHGAALSAAILSFSLVGSMMLPQAALPIVLGAPLLLGVLILLAATRLGEGEWGLAAALITAIVHTQWIVTRPASFPDARTALLLMLASVVVFVAWPFAARRAAASRWIWWAAAVAGPLWFFPMRRTWVVWQGRSAIGLLPLALGGIALLATYGVRRTRALPEPARRSATVAFSAVAICFASIAIALQLEKSWITVGWALEGAALVWLWRRLDHPGLKWFGLAHLGAAAFRLVPTAVLLGSYPRSGTPIVNWLLYTYLVPAAAMFAAAWLLAPDEAARARPSEREIYAKGRAVGSIVASIAGIFTVFVWINLAIADWFADGPRLTLEFGRAPARDLTVSIAWALYALILLGFGMARARTGLRWLSLGFLLVTIAKVFLYDLGELRDLYRVLSLVGLALSLLLVSVLYQRFVFRSPAASS